MKRRKDLNSDRGHLHDLATVSVINVKLNKLAVVTTSVDLGCKLGVTRRIAGRRYQLVTTS